MIQEATAKTFDSLIDTEYAVVDCYGDYCGACVMLEPVYKEVAADLAGIRFIEINITHEWDIAERFGIDAMPTLLFFRGGKEVHRIEGSMDREELNRQIAVMLYE